MNKNIKLPVVFLSLIAAVTLFSCNPDGAGIFYTIATEQKITSSVLSDKAIYAIVSDGTRLYTLAGRAIYYRDGSSWKKIAAPDGSSKAVSLAQINNGTTITVYAVYEDDSGSPLQDSLFTLNSSAFTWSPAEGASSVADSPGLELLPVRHDSGILFLSQQQTDTTTGDKVWKVFSYDGTTLTDITTTDLTIPPVGAAEIVTTTTTYYIAASNATDSSALFTTTGTGTLTAGSDPTTEAIGGITEDGTAATLYLSTKNGYIYSSTDGTNWTPENTSPLKDTSDDDAQLGPLGVVTFQSVDYLIIAGNTGYYEWNLSSGSPQYPTETVTDFSTYDLSREMVFSIYTDADNTFYLGSYLGLWYNNSGIFDQR